VIREDVVNPNLPYIGTEFGRYASIDRDESCTRLNGSMPTVAVHEVAIHPPTGESVAAMHGRSLWVFDVTPLRQSMTETRDEQAHFQEPKASSMRGVREGCDP